MKFSTKVLKSLWKRPRGRSQGRMQQILGPVCTRLGHSPHGSGPKLARKLRESEIGVQNWTTNLVVGGAAKDFDGVRQKVRHDVQRLHRAARAARQIDDHCAFANTCDRARKHGARIFLAPLFPHELAETGQDFFADSRCRFRSRIARAHTRAAGGENDVHGIRRRQGNEPLLQRIAVIRNNCSGDHLPAKRPAALSNGRSGAVLALAARDRITYGEDRDAHQRSAPVRLGTKTSAAKAVLISDGRPRLPVIPHSALHAVAIGFVHQAHGFHQQAGGGTRGGGPV